MPLRLDGKCFNQVGGRLVEVPCPEGPPRIGPTGPGEDITRFIEQEIEEEEAAVGGAAVGGDRDVTRTGEERVRITGTFDTTSDRLIRESVRTYINVPTPEQVLDDMETGISTYIGSLVQTGQLGQGDANIALQQLMPLFMTDYLADLGQRAARGEDIFRVVGVEGAPEFLGTRVGEVSARREEEERRMREEERQIARGTETVTEAAEREPATVEEALAVGPFGPGVARPLTETTTTRARTEQEREEERETRGREVGVTTFQETEAIFRRPQLAFVRAVSPIEFMKQRFGSPGELAAFIRGRKGERARQAQTAAGGPIAQARRV